MKNHIRTIMAACFIIVAILAANAAKAQPPPTIGPSYIPHFSMPIGSYQTKEFTVQGGEIQSVTPSSTNSNIVTVQEANGGNIFKRFINFIAKQIGRVSIRLSFSIKITGTNNTTVVAVEGEVSVTAGDGSSYMASQYFIPSPLIAIKQDPLNFQSAN